MHLKKNLSLQQAVCHVNEATFSLVPVALESLCVVSSQCLCREKKPNLSEQVFPAGENHILAETGFSLCQNLPLKDGEGNYSHSFLSIEKPMNKLSESHSLLCGTCLVPVLPLLPGTAIILYVSFHSLIQSLNIHWFSALSQVCYFRLCRKWKNGMLRWDTLGIQRLGHLPLLKYYLWFHNSKKLLRV